jgi:hypothetical protein
MVQVHHDEGVAIHIAPESCAVAREDHGEALTGGRVGQPLSRESTLLPGADVVPLTEGKTDGRDIASAQMARRSRRPWHARTLCVREPGDLTIDRRRWSAYGKPQQQLRRHIPKVGAVCGNSACTDLCGGRLVTAVPTAIIS